MKIYITGVSGTGKSSLARSLKDRGVNAIDIDEISHWENKTTKDVVGWEPGSSDEWLAAHDWVCDLSKLKTILESSKNSVALGHASNQEKYLFLFDKIFVLECKPETVIHRITTRTDNDFGKHPDDMKRILNWNEEFTSWMVNKGALIIDAEKPIEDITQDIISIFN